MNLLFFLTPKQDVLFIYEDFTLRQTLEKWSNQRFATIPVLKRNGEYLGTMTEGDILWGIKSIHGLDIDASEDIPIASFPRRRDYKAVPVTTDMHALLNAAVDQNFVPVPIRPMIAGEIILSSPLNDFSLSRAFSVSPILK